ncbi:hypothetical protein YC2023_057583 [Brassica napus]
MTHIGFGSVIFNLPHVRDAPTKILGIVLAAFRNAPGGAPSQTRTSADTFDRLFSPVRKRGRSTKEPVLG